LLHYYDVAAMLHASSCQLIQYAVQPPPPLTHVNVACVGTLMVTLTQETHKTGHSIDAKWYGNVSRFFNHR
jgi:hypothetical protein